MRQHVDYASMHFHEHLGYRLVGRFHSCGYKFDTWYGYGLDGEVYRDPSSTGTTAR